VALAGWRQYARRGGDVGEKIVLTLDLESDHSDDDAAGFEVGRAGASSRRSVRDGRACADPALAILTGERA
jgi:hypothetical protein